MRSREEPILSTAEQKEIRERTACVINTIWDMVAIPIFWVVAAFAFIFEGIPAIWRFLN